MADQIFFYPISSIEKQFPYLYVLEIAGMKIMWSQGFPLQDLLYQTLNQKLKKIKLNEQKEYATKEGDHVFMNNTVRFNLQLINRIAFNEIDIFLVCTQLDLCLVNYLVRLKQFKPQIICTNAAFILGSHFIKELYNWSESRNRYFYSFQENYEKEDEAFKLFEETYNTNFQEFTEVFPFKDFDCTLVNYGQIVKIQLLQIQEQLNIEAQSSGTGIGDAAFIISLGDYFKIVIANELNNQNNGFIHKEISDKIKQCDYMILGMSQPKINYKFLSETYEYLGLGHNVVIPFNSYQTILNLQDEIDDHLQHKCHRIFIISSEFYNYTLMANTQVEYLSKRIQSLLMKENPQNPLNKLLFLIKSQKITVVPSVEQLKFEGFSLKETIKGATPSVFFIFDSSIRLSQALFLFDLLEQVGQSTNTIYTTKAINSNDLTFVLQLIDQNFYDERLLYQIKNSYKFHVVQTPINNQIQEFIAQSDSSIKTILIPECNTIQANSLIFNYKMSQKINLKITQITIPIQPIFKGQGKKIIGNIELSDVNVDFTEKNEIKVDKINPPEIYYYVGQITEQTLMKISDEITKQVGYFLKSDITSCKGLLEFINMENQISLRVDVQQNETIVYAKTNEEIQRISEIVNKCLTLRKL